MSPETLISDDLPLPVLIMSGDMRSVIWANQTAQEWAGVSLRRLIKKNLKDIIVNLDPIIRAGLRCRDDLAPVSLYNFEVKRSDNLSEINHITAFPSGQNIGLLVQPIGPVPNQSHTGDFAASAMGRMLAHEIKNPLAGIDGATQLLALDLTDEDSIALTDLIRSEIGRIRRLADRMESLGDSDPENIAPLNIHTLLDKARKVVENAAPDTIDFQDAYDPTLPYVMGDADTLMQALLNLLKNAAEAIEHSGNPGEIRIETAFRSGVTRHDFENGETRPLPIEIRIIDNGPGVSDTVRHRLFQPFVTNKPAGQGLGLALVSKVATAHGGLVELESRPGHTVFSILLPADPPPEG